MPLDAVLGRLAALHPQVIDLSLDRILRLLAALGHPERSLPPTIHVAGTNGKGSTIAFLRAIYEAAGYRVHVYTSPHLVRFAERIRLAGTLISDDALTSLLEECERCNEGQTITFFEATTAAAFLAFARTPADILLLETGMGGRLDATNVVEHPALSVLTPLSLDHQSYLGSTLTAIAGEKAAILKSGGTCISAAQPEEARIVIETQARIKGVPLRFDGRDWTCRTEGEALFYHGPAAAWTLPRPALPGEHQTGNAGLALACVEHLLPSFPVTADALAQGLTTVSWPARLQRLRQGPLVQALPPEWELWLDGGHNPAAGVVLAQQATQWRDRPLYLVFGMLGTKDTAGFLTPLASQVAGLYAVPIPSEALALSAEDAASYAMKQGISIVCVSSSPEEAVHSILAKAEEPGRILICGSLYLAGTILRDNA